jgi:protein ImuA
MFLLCSILAMPRLDQTLEKLRSEVARIEGRRAVAVSAPLRLGCPALDLPLGGGLARGSLHELVATGAPGGGPAGSVAGVAGFAAALMACAARAELTDDGPGPAFAWLRTERAEALAGQLHGPGLADLALDPARLLLGVLPDDEALLQAALEVARCPAIAVLVIECWGAMPRLDLGMTRRLALTSAGSGVTVLLLRLGGAGTASAAQTRWQLRPALSAALPMRAPGAPAWGLELLRHRAGVKPQGWRLEWNRDDRHFRNAALPGASLPDAFRRPLATAGEGLRRSA